MEAMKLIRLVRGTIKMVSGHSLIEIETRKTSLYVREIVGLRWGINSPRRATLIKMQQLKLIG